MTKIDMTTVRAMAEAGIELVGNVVGPGGNHSVFMRPEDVPEYVADPEAFYAKAHGASKDEFRDWVATEGTPRCGATTASGKRCRNIVAGGIQRSLEDWLQEDGGFCTVHGGAGSSEARGARRR